jgi:hypothetical protein
MVEVSFMLFGDYQCGGTEAPRSFSGAYDGDQDTMTMTMAYTL